MRKPWYQRTLELFSYLAIGFLGLGVFLDAVGNARTLISSSIASISTAVIIILRIVFGLYLGKHGLDWVGKDRKSKSKITKLGIEKNLAVIGVIALLWVPFGISFLTDLQEEKLIRMQENEASNWENRAVEAISKGRYKEAVNYSEQAIKVSQNLKDRPREGRALNILATAYYRMNDYEIALSTYEKALVIERELENLGRETLLQLNIGDIYASQGDAYQAINHFTYALDFSEKLGNRRTYGHAVSKINKQRRTLGLNKNDNRAEEDSELASAFVELYGYYIDNQKEYLDIYRQSGMKAEEGNFLGGLGKMLHETGQFKEALEKYREARVIFREIGDRENEAVILKNIGDIYHDQSEFDQAVYVYEHSRQIISEIGNKVEEVKILNGIGKVYQQQEKFTEARQSQNQALLIARLIGNELLEEQTLNLLEKVGGDPKN